MGLPPSFRLIPLPYHDIGLHTLLVEEQPRILVEGRHILKPIKRAGPIEPLDRD